VAFGLTADTNPAQSATSDSSPPSAAIPCPPTPPGQPAPACKDGLAIVPPASASMWPTSGTVISESAAITLARDGGSSPAATAPAYAEQTTYRAAAALVGEVPQPSLDPSTAVWVITVDAAPRNSLSYTTPVPQGQSQPDYTPPPQPTYSSYTFIIDAYNGAPIDVCAPCAGRVASG